MSNNTMKWPGRMNPTDALFWLMNKIPEMRSTIGSLLILARPPSHQRLRNTFERLSCQLVRMRQRVVEIPFGLAPPEWIEDSQFDLDYHLRYVGVPAPGGIEELLAELSPLFAVALDPDRPLWEAYVAEGLSDGRGAIFVKMHHCLTDGVGGARLSEQLLSDGAEGDGKLLRVPVDERSSAPPALIGRALLHNLQESVTLAQSAAGSIVAALEEPLETVRALRRGVRTLTGFGSELAVKRAESPLHQQRSLSRRLSVFEMPLAAINGVRKRLGATNNDVVLTIVSGAMHRWHASRGADPQELRTLVPVNLRAVDDASAGNRLALLAVSLPVGESNPLRRLRRIQERMGQVKADRRASLYPFLARVMTAMPLSLAERIARQQTTRTNFLCTNVPGSKEPVYLAGELIERIYPYAPLVGDHPVAIALYSYRNTMCVGLDVDPLAMDDLPQFRDALREAYEEVLAVSKTVGVYPPEHRHNHKPRARETGVPRARRHAPPHADGPVPG